MKQDFTIWRNQILQNPRDISPLKFGISQDEVIEIFGNPDAVSTMRSDGKPLILVTLNCISIERPLMGCIWFIATIRLN